MSLVFSTEITIRGYHVDVYGHVNNARWVELLEEARVAFLLIDRRSGRPRPMEGEVRRMLVRYQPGGVDHGPRQGPR